MYNHDDGVMIFTVPNWYRSTVDKCDLNPHYGICSVDKLNLVLYYFDDDGGGSKFLQQWVSFPKNLKEKNKKRGLTEEKKSRVFQIYIQR